MDKQERFSIRKLTVGVASVTIGFWLAGAGNVAHADTVDGNISQTQVKTDNTSVDKKVAQSTNTDTEQDAKNQTNNSDVVKSTDTKFVKLEQEKDQTQTDVVNSSTQAGITDPAINRTSPIDIANVAKSSSVSKDALNQSQVVANDKTNLVNDTFSSSMQRSKQLDNTSVKTNVLNQVTTDTHYVGSQHIKIDDAFKDAFPKSFTVDDSLKYKDLADQQFKNNTYQSDPVAKTEPVDVYNLTDSQLTRINKYTTDIVNKLRHDVGIDKTEDYKINTDLMKWQQNQTKKQAELNMWGHNAEYLHGAGENVGALPIDNTTGRSISELKPSDFNFTYDPNAKTVTTWSPAIAVKTMDDLYAVSYYMTSIFMFEDYGIEANSHAENLTFTNRGPKQYSELGIYPATDPKTKKTNLFFRWIVPNVDTFNAANVDGNKNNISADPGPVNKQVIHLIDETDSSNKVSDLVISNPAGTVLNAAINAPTNYVLAENNTLPSTFDFTHGDLPDMTIHVKHDIEIVNDTRNNASDSLIVHYCDDKGNKLKDDTIITYKFHRDYTIDKATDKSTIGSWEYVKGSMTQTGTHIDNLSEPGSRYNSVSGFDSFNAWVPYNVPIDGYTQPYSGLNASLSIPNTEGYIYNGGLTSEVTVTYTAKKQFTINVYDDDLDSNGKPIGIVGSVSPEVSHDTQGGYAALKVSWPEGVSTNLNDYIISGVPDNVPENVTIAGDYWDVLKIGNSAGSLIYPNWRVSDMNDVAGKTFTIHIKSKAPAQIQVTYRFVANGQQVGQYQTDTFNTDKTYTIDTNKFKSSIPNHYYLDSKYQIPTSVKYTDGMKANTVIDVPVYKANVYTIKFYDDTENEQSGSYDGISWDGITDKRLTGTIADLQALIDSYVEKLTHDSNAYRQKLDVAKTPAVATVTGYDLKDDDTGNVTSGSAVPVVADLPHTDSTITIHFVHNFLDFTGKAPLYTSSSIMLKDVDSANKLANVLNKSSFKYSRLTNITIDDLRDALNGAKWTSGGTIVENNEYGTIFQADGNDPNIFLPTVTWRANINNTTKVLSDAFWTDKIENRNTGNHDGTILGNPYLVPIKVHVDLFSPKFEHFRVSNSTVHADLSEPLALKTADILKPGYHYEVLVGNKTGYEYIPVNSTVLQNASTIPDQINMLANLMGTKTLSTNSDLKDVDVSSIVETSMTTPMSLKLVQTETVNYEYQLENPAFGLDNQVNFASMDIDGLVPYLSPMYKEALKNVAKQSGMSDMEIVGVTYDQPAIMLYVAVPNDETATIKYIDDDTNTVLKTDTVNGKTDKLIEFNDDPSIVINDFEKQGYKVGSNTYKSGINFSTTNDFEVHFKHETKPANESRTKKLIVHYVYAAGQPRSGKAHDDQSSSDIVFSRTGTTDLVTNTTSWNNWTVTGDLYHDSSDDETNFSANFYDVLSPNIDGYTPDPTVITAQFAMPDSPERLERTVTYKADSQNIIVNYIDDTTGKTLKTINKVGQSDESANYDTKSDISKYIGQHYDLVSDDTNGSNLVFDHDDNTDQVYNVHLRHATHQINDRTTKSEVIHYVYADGLARTDQASDDYTNQVHFTRDGYHDEVTNEDHWNAWTPDTQEFAAVKSPEIQGYTADQTEIPAIKVNADSDNIERTVTYKANKQKLDVSFIDDTTGKTLSTVTKEGISDERVNYNTANDLDHYKSLHYNVVSDSTNGQNLVFDHDNSKDQHYEVHLVHATHPINEQTSTKQTIHYQLADGTKVFDDHTAQVDFSRDGYNDEVTNEDHWNKWSPSDIQTFSNVVSPVKSGYTPDQTRVAAVDVHPGDKDIDETVIYSSDTQVMTINYIDDVTGKTLSTKQIIGISDASANYNTKSSINSYVADHYKLVSDDTNSDNLVFDHDDSINQVYNVHLTHTYQNVDEHKSVNETVHYIYDNGQTSHPDYKALVINFSRTGIKDLVTSDIVWNAWAPSEQSFDQVTTPAINGYTPDAEFISNIKVNHESSDVERTVIYHADDQTILVNYIDDDTYSTLKTDTVIGKTAQKSNYTTKKSIDGYIADHYELVSDDTNDNELVFDSDSTKAQVYNVHLKHAHQKVSDSALVNESIHYIYADGSKARDDYRAPAISFKRTGDKDLVTNTIVWNAWSPASQDFKTVDSPVIAGYTPSQKTISNITVKPGDKDIDQAVVYAPDTQAIVVNYSDDVTGKTLKTDTLTGKSDRASDYTTKNNIDGYENQHYVLVSDDTHGKTLTFDHDDNATQVYNVHLSHQTEPASQSRTVHEAIHYVYADGYKVADTAVAKPLIFTQTGVKDLVTGDIDWNGTWTDEQTFAEVESPEITGYTASRKVVDPITVDHNSSDIHQTVIYTANDQAAKIKYIDDVTGKTLETNSANGKFGEMINFDHNVDDRIKAFENQGYRLVSNNFDNQTYTANNEQNVFVVHLAHGKTNVQRDDIVTETIEYQFEDGQKAHDSMIQQIKFVQNGRQDSVTKSVVWTPSRLQQFETVTTPDIEGYTPNISQISAKTITFGDSDLNYVVKYIANMQNAKILYIDDNTGTLLKSEHAIGKFNTIIDFNINPITQISEYINSGYRLVSNNFNNQAYKTDNEQNRFTVHLAHNTQNVQRTKTLMRVIKYQYANGQKASDDVVQTAEFTQQGVKDLVNDEITWSQTSDHQFARVITPQIVGYCPDKTSIDTETIAYDGHNQTIIVTYNAQELSAQLRIIDDTTGQVLAIDDASGKYHELIEFNDLQKQLQDLQKHGYQITSNTFNNQHYNVDKSQNIFEIHVVKHDDVKHDDIKHDDVKHEDIKHDDIKHDDIKHDDIKHDDVKHEDIKHEDIKHDDIKHDDIKHEDIKHEDIKHEDIKHEDIKHEDIKHEDIKHEDIKHENIKHEAIKHEAIKHEAIKHVDSLIIRKVHKAEKTLPQTGADDTRIPSVIGAISSLIAGLGLVGVSHKKRKKND